MSLNEIYFTGFQLSVLSPKWHDENGECLSILRGVPADYEVNVRKLPYYPAECKYICSIDDFECRTFYLNSGDLSVIFVNIVRNIDKYKAEVLSMLDEAHDLVQTYQSMLRDRNGPLFRKDGFLDASSNLFQAFNHKIARNCVLSTLYQTIIDYISDDIKYDNGYMSGAFDDIFESSENTITAEGVYVGLALLENPKVGIVETSIVYDIWNRSTLYHFKSFDDLLIFDLFEFIKSNPVIKVCENCGSLFIPVSRSDEIYCNYSFVGRKSCKEIGYANKVKKDSIMNTYRKIYKTQNARKQRVVRAKSCPHIEDRFDKWTEYAKSKLLDCQTGKISMDDMISAISSAEWTKGSV